MVAALTLGERCAVKLSLTEIFEVIPAMFDIEHRINTHPYIIFFFLQ